MIRHFSTVCLIIVAARSSAPEAISDFFAQALASHRLRISPRIAQAVLPGPPRSPLKLRLGLGFEAVNPLQLLNELNVLLLGVLGGNLLIHDLLPCVELVFLLYAIQQ